MKLRLTPVALDDVAAIRDRPAVRTKELARRVEDAVFRCLDLLAEFPQLERKTSERYTAVADG